MSLSHISNAEVTVNILTEKDKSWGKNKQTNNMLASFGSSTIRSQSALHHKLWLSWHQISSHLIWWPGCHTCHSVCIHAWVSVCTSPWQPAVCGPLCWSTMDQNMACEFTMGFWGGFDFRPFGLIVSVFIIFTHKRSRPWFNFISLPLFVPMAHQTKQQKWVERCSGNIKWILVKIK